MQLRERKLPWWLIIVTGIIIVAAGIFVLIDKVNGLNVLVFLVGIGALSFALFNFIIAFKNRNDNTICISHLVQGLIDIVLLLLIIVIRNTPTLLGIIVACWLLAFGIFELTAGRKLGSSKRIRLGVLLTIIGLVVLIVPLVFSIDYLALIGIVGIAFGVMRIILGVLIRTNDNKGVSNLM